MAVQRAALAREIDEQVPLLTAAAHRLVDVVTDVRELALPRDASTGVLAPGDEPNGGGAAWRGQASTAFAEASRSLTRDLSRVAEDLASARAFCTRASAEVTAGV